MNNFIEFVKRHALATYFVLAFLGFWAFLPLASISPALPLFIGTFIPALAAIIVSSLTGGRTAVTTLLRKILIWRVGIQWYIIALGLPVLIDLVAVGFGLLLGSPTATRFGSLSILTLLFFPFALGEELGWRGYALPRLLEKNNPLTAGLILGIIWAAWHLPTYLPGQALADSPPLASTITIIAYSLILTWLFINTMGSVLIAVLFHGAANAAGILLVGMSSDEANWLRAGITAAVAVIIVLLNGLSTFMQSGAAISPGELI